jgi:hypothetical protein
MGGPEIKSGRAIQHLGRQDQLATFEGDLAVCIHGCLERQSASMMMKHRTIDAANTPQH